MDDFHIFLPLSKVEKQADGSRIITGYASTPSKDLDGEIVTLNAVRKALPSYMEWRNIRQMHQDIAVGIAKEASVDKNGLFLRAKIVEPTCVKLIDEEVLKGLSIGGKKLKKVGNEITEINLVEISVVDRPANPDCRFEVQKMAKGAVLIGEGDGLDTHSDMGLSDETGWLRKTIERVLFRELSANALSKTAEIAPSPTQDDDTYYEELCKRKFTTDQRQESESKGHAMPGGGYPIENKNDVRNAVQAFGRAKNPEATKKHIIQQAKRLGATDELPADWESSTKTEKSAMIDIFKAVKQPDFGWEHFDALVKAAPIELEIPPEAAERLAKGLGTVGDLSYAFSTIRGCQRRLIAEGVIEKDGEDAQLARRLGQVAAELASVISEKAQHEASEAVYLTDADDITSYVLSNNEGIAIMALNANKDDLAKRASKAVRAHMDKVKDHLDKAMGAHGEAMKCLGKAGQMLASDMGKALGNDALLKGTTAKIMDHLKKAHEGFSAAADQMELGKAAMVKASSSDVTAPGPGANTGGLSSIDQATMTEGEVPWYDATEDYFASARTRQAASGDGEVYTKSEVEALVKAATAETRSTALEQQNKTLTELLQKTPAGSRKSVVFPAPDKGLLTGHEEGGGDRNAVLLDGIDLSNIGDPDSRRKAAGTMVANMINNPRMFAKSLFDPSFKGLAGTKRAS